MNISFPFKFLSLLGLLFFLFILGGCGQQHAQGPPEIRYGKDSCIRCKMIINDPRFASAYRTEDGEVRRFDDIGGMALYHRKNGEEVTNFWVHDYHSEEWIKAGNAFFAANINIKTPMGYGVAGFASEEEANTLASREGGEVLTWTQLLNTKKGNLETMGKGEDREAKTPGEEEKKAEKGSEGSKGTVLSPPEDYVEKNLPFVQYGENIPRLSLEDPLKDREVQIRQMRSSKLLTFFYSTCKTVCPALIGTLRYLRIKQ